MSRGEGHGSKVDPRFTKCSKGSERLDCQSYNLDTSQAPDRECKSGQANRGLKTEKKIVKFFLCIPPLYMLPEITGILPLKSSCTVLCESLCED